MFICVVDLHCIHRRKKTSQASAWTESESPSVHEVTTTSSSCALLLFCFLGPLWISHSKMKEKISRLPQTTAFLCHCPLSFSFILHIYKNVTAVCRFLIQVKHVPWILYLNWKGIDHFLCFHRGPDPKLEEEHSSSHQLRSVCDRHRAGFLHAVGTVDFPFCYFPLSKDMEFIPGDLLKFIYTTVSWSDTTSSSLNIATVCFYSIQQCLGGWGRAVTVQWIYFQEIPPFIFFWKCLVRFWSLLHTKSAELPHSHQLAWV